MSREQAHLRSAAKYNEKGHVRKAIAHFGRAIHYRAQQFGGLPPCKYGAGCYRKNPDHFEQFSHPDGYVHLERRIKDAPTVDTSHMQERDYEKAEKLILVARRLREEAAREGLPKVDAPKCSAGGGCTITDKQHFRELRH